MFDQHGTSPRTRGKLFPNITENIHQRNIPAHAGKTFSECSWWTWGPEHPRARGENSVTPSPTPQTAGTSPRTRGKRPRARIRHRGQRNIPAHAGKTAASCDARDALREHPRARGENPWPTPRPQRIIGTSPRTRGKLILVASKTFSNRNIPAHAGKTNGHADRVRRHEEHPRARGENQVLSPCWPGLVGTSPRTRGKLQS